MLSLKNINIKNLIVLCLLVLGSFQLAGQTPIELTSGTELTAQTSNTDNFNFTLCGNFYGGSGQEELIYHITAPSTNVDCAGLTISGLTQTWVGAFVYEGALPTDNSACYASVENATVTDDLELTFSMTANEEYYIIVVGDGVNGPSTVSNINILINAASVPAPFVNMSTASMTISDGTPLNFYDSGGPNCNYENGENHTLTICPDAAGVAADKIVQLDFTNFNLNESACADTKINIYKGEGVSGDQIYAGDYANIVHQQDIQIFSSIVPGGCMTIEWTSHAANCEGEGWEAQFTLIDNPCSSPIEDVCGLTAPLISFGESINGNTECFTTATGTACGVGGNNGAWFQVIAEEGVDEISIDYAITGGNACYAADDIATPLDEPTNDEIANNTGLQLLLYRGCGSDELCASNPILATGGINVNNGVYASGTWTSDISVATIGAPPAGNVYYVRVTSFGGDLCDFQLTASTGIAAPSNCEPNAGIPQN